MKRRWKFGVYDLKYNPKSLSGGKTATGDILMTANGLVSSNNQYYEEELQFTFDIYEKPTNFLSAIKTYSNSYYTSVTEDDFTANLTVLRKGTNLCDVFTKAGTTVALGKSLNLDGGSIVSSIVRINSSNIACMFPTGNLIICADNGVQIGKYTYTDQDIKDTISMTWDGNTYIYLLNKFGRIFKVNRSNGSVSTECTFADFGTNKSNAKPSYTGIHLTNNGYIGVVNGNRILYFNMQYDVIHSISLPIDSVSSISYGQYSGSYYITTDSLLRGFLPNMSPIEVDKIKKQLSTGKITIVDENNISNSLFVKKMSIDRIRNLQDSRYEIAISGLKGG